MATIDLQLGWAGYGHELRVRKIACVGDAFVDGKPSFEHTPTC